MTINPNEQLPTDSLDGQLATPREVVAWLNAQRVRQVTATSAELHLYADGTSGDDANSGLSAGSPKKTLQAVFDLVPDLIKHTVVVHLAGVFDEEDGILDVHIAGTNQVLIDGGDSVVVIDDDGGANYEADSSSTSSLGDSGATWSTNEHRGYWVEVLSGPAAGQTRTVASNTATVITPVRNWSVDPGTGATFRIVRPATTYQASTDYHTLQMINNSLGSGSIKLQRMYVAGSKANILTNQGGYVVLTGIVNDSSRSNAMHFIGMTQVIFGGALTDPNTLAYLSAATDPSTPVSQRNAAAYVKFQSCYLVQIHGAVIHDLQAEGLLDMYIASGAQIEGAVFKAVYNSRSSSTVTNSSGYATTSLGGGAVGLTLDNCHVRLKSGDISGCSSHAIVAMSSRVEFTGAFAGSSNTGAGVYAHLGTKITITDGAAPALTGTIGDLSTDGTTGEDLGSGVSNFWSDVDGGAQLSDTTEFVVVKEA